VRPYNPRRLAHGRLRFTGAALAALLGLAAAPIARGEAQAKGFLAPAGGERFAAGAVVTARWSPPDGGERDEAELLLSLDGGVTFPIRLTAQMPTAGSGIRWRVPALATTRGRLALRVGEEGRPESERIEAVSEPFSIVADAAAEGEELFRGATEWWTRQALADIGAEDLLSGSVHGEPRRIVRPGDSPDISEPGSVTLPPPTAACGEALVPSALPRAAWTISAILRRPAPVPLRE
jgi:hypothetical protein